MLSDHLDERIHADDVMDVNGLTDGYRYRGYNCLADCCSFSLSLRKALRCIRREGNW